MICLRQTRSREGYLYQSSEGKSSSPPLISPHGAIWFVRSCIRGIGSHWRMEGKGMLSYLTTIREKIYSRHRRYIVPGLQMTRVTLMCTTRANPVLWTYISSYAPSFMDSCWLMPPSGLGTFRHQHLWSNIWNHRHRVRLWRVYRVEGGEMSF